MSRYLSLLVFALLLAVASVASSGGPGDLYIKDARIIPPPAAGSIYECEVLIDGGDRQDLSRYKNLRIVYEFPRQFAGMGHGGGPSPIRDRRVKPGWEKGWVKFDFTSDSRSIERITVCLTYEDNGVKITTDKVVAILKK